jgi:hypothetical protein
MLLVAILLSVLPFSMADGLPPSIYGAVTALYSSLGEIEFHYFFLFRVSHSRWFRVHNIALSSICTK